MYILRVEDEFDAAHFLPWHEGKCRQVHGHRWRVRVTIKAKSLNENGVIVDFGRIKALLPDHLFLNDWIDNPTAERIADELYERLCGLLWTEGVMDNIVDLSVRVWESPGCSVERVSK